MSPHRIAIVGFGPKGLFALERLLHYASGGGSPASLKIDLFEPHPVLAAGPVYDPRQPRYLRMNFAAEQVDMWPASTRAVPAREALSFSAWRDSQETPEREEYPPRAQVGRYLAAGFDTLLAHAPAGVEIELRPASVRAIRREPSGWRIATCDPAAKDPKHDMATARTRTTYDEVLVAVGHQPRWTQGLDVAWPHHAPLVPSVFPVKRRLGPEPDRPSRLSREIREGIAPGSIVAVRGFALTFIDAALALTEGRGGSFSETAHPYRLAYSPANGEAAAIVPFSRSGRPMLAKPSPRQAANSPALEAIAEPGRRRVLALADGFSVERDLIAIVDAVAEESLIAAAGADRAPAEGPTAELERSLAIAVGEERPDMQWALGHAWRAVYPAIVARLGGDGIVTSEWPRFRVLAARMERVAFGPPVVNAAKLLALIDAGRVDVSHLRGEITSDFSETSITSAAGRREVDVVVDAVLPGPGAIGLRSELLEQLVADGHARIAPRRRGLEVNEEAACIGADGNHSPGLAAIGRPTEDSVIGNDTLSRTLHPNADRWARGVAERCAETVAGATLA